MLCDPSNNVLSHKNGLIFGTRAYIHVHDMKTMMADFLLQSIAGGWRVVKDRPGGTA